MAEKTPIGRAVSDTLTFELQKPVLARVRTRLEEIKALSSAHSEKIEKGGRAIWKTTPPKMFISGLNCSIEGGIGIISYNVYKTDEKGNKVVKIRRGKSPVSDREIDMAAEYVFDYFMVETCEPRKAWKIEKVNPGEDEEN